MLSIPYFIRCSLQMLKTNCSIQTISTGFPHRLIPGTAPESAQAGIPSQCPFRGVYTPLWIFFAFLI